MPRTAVTSGHPVASLGETAADVTAADRDRADELKQQFLLRQPDLDPEVAPFWGRYQRAFSAEHMDATPDQQFKDFGNSPIGAYAGMMTVFNDEWNLIGPEAGARRVRESLKYLHPDRLLPITMYTGSAGKREIAEKLFGLKLPKPESTSATPGRLVFWSNDLLRELVGDGFLSMQHASQFPWWAKDQVKISPA